MLDISLQKPRNHRCQQNKEHDADDAKQLSAQHRPQWGKSLAAADRMRVACLIINLILNKKDKRLIENA